MSKGVHILYGLYFILFVAVEGSDLAHSHASAASVPFNIPRNRTDNEDNAHNICNMTVRKKSAQFFKYEIETWNPNFANLELSFGNYPFNRTKDVILPMKWFWTYYSPEGYFPYLKWPVDFPILSLSLLNARSVPVKLFVNIEVLTPNCSVVMGQRKTTEAIAQALGNMTQDYLMTIQPRSYSYSYFCYMAERPQEKGSWDYLLGVYLGFPSDFEGYNCCRTDVDKTKEHNNLRITCLNYQIKKMYQCTVIPFLISLIVFAYFPIFLASVSSNLVKLDENTPDNISDEEWIYLSGNSPLTFTTLLCGLCGLSKKHQNVVSRLRRFLFILLAPCVIYIQLIVYRNNEFVKAFIRHGSPMAYLSMLGGFNISRSLFLPILGGPFILLIVFYIGSFVFIFLPKSLNVIMENGISITDNPYIQELNLLTLSDRTVEELSAIPVCKHHGYSRLANRCKAGFFMSLNTDFWRYAFSVQLERFSIIRRYIQVRSGRKRMFISLVVVPLLLALYLPLCILESIFAVCLYGVPLFSFIKYVVRSYIKSILETLRCENMTQNVHENNESYRGIHQLIRTVLTVLLGIFFVHYIFSFCTIFCASLSFLAKVVVFSFLAVIVYPAYSFGYLFFGLAFFYYFFKLLQGFGEVYYELLHDAVDISDNLDVNTCDSRSGQEVAVTHINKIRYRNHKMGIPRDLFDFLVRKFRPVHIQVVKSLMRLVLILSLIIVTITTVLQGSYQQKAAISEVIHVIFIVAVGALPRLLELALSTMNESVKKDIEIRKMTAMIQQYWRDREFIVVN